MSRRTQLFVDPSERAFPGGVADSAVAGSAVDWVWPDPECGDIRTVVREEPVSASPVKVLHVITRFVDGAGGNTLVSVLGLNRVGFEPWIAGAEGGALWARAEAERVATVKLRHMRGPMSPLHDLLAIVELVRLIRRERFTIVHTHSSKAGFVGRVAALLCRVPIVLHTIHGFSWHDYMTPRRRRLYVTLERLVRPYTDAFLAVSPRVAQDAVDIAMADRANTFVVPSAIELDTVPTRPDSLIRDELGIPEDAVVVGTVGRLDLQKAPLDFVRMAAAVQRTRPGARFVVVGEGELMNDTRKEACRLGVDLLLTGYTPEAARIASTFDVYVVSSIYEGVGRAMCEALASGRPVVATAVNGVVDVIEDGVTGLLAQPRDPDGLARKVIWALDHQDDALRMGRAGAERVRTLFHPSLMCALIELHYLRLLGARR